MDPDQPRSIKDWSQREIDIYWVSMHRLATVRTIVTVGMAIIFWEHLLHLPAEIRTVRLLLAGKIQPARLAVCLSRYVCLVMCVLISLFYWGRRIERCFELWRTIYFLFVVLWACQSSIFLMRVHIIFNGNRLVLAGYGIIWASAIGIWLYNASRQSAFKIATAFKTPYSPECGIGPYRAMPGAIAWGSYVLFDSSVLLGTWLRLRHLNLNKGTSRGARSRRWLWASNLAYFSISSLFNVGCLIASLLITDSTYSHAPSPVAWVVQTVVASRLVLDTKGWAQADDDEVRGPTNTFNMKKRRTLGHADSVISYTVDETVVTSAGYSGEYDEPSSRTRRVRSRRVPGPACPTAAAAAPETHHNLETSDSADGTAVNSTSPSEADLSDKKFGLKDLQSSLEQSAGSSTAHTLHDTDIECAGKLASHDHEDEANGEVVRYNVTMTRASSDDFAPVASPINHSYDTNALGAGDAASTSNVSRSSSFCKSTTSMD